MLNAAMEQKILTYLEENQQQLYDMLSQLVQVDTQNYITHGKENDGQARLEELCKALSLKVDRFTPDSIPGLTESDEFNPGRGTENRENLVAIYQGKNPSRSIMLAAHMDTMPVGDLSKWENDPFSGLVQDGKIYGRGSGDDKFGLALGWFLIKAFQDCGYQPERNVLIGSYIDEEYGGGNGALGLCLKYPCDCYVNLDSSGFETVALGGGCFEITVRTTKNDKAIASVFEVFDGLAALRRELGKLQSEKTVVRFSSFRGGDGGEKVGSMKLAIYTDMTKEETLARLAGIVDRLRPEFEALNLTTDGFILTTKFFRYGEADPGSKEIAALSDIIADSTGIRPDTRGTCLSDLSIFLNYGSRNSFSFGIPRGSETGGGAHQPNEHIQCSILLECAKRLAKLLLRT